MTTTDAATFCATLVDEWARGGVSDAFVAPGSRSTPMALALAADERIAVHVFHDERAAAFAALGHGLATGLPAVVVCTSGTAATHLHAAVVEADLSSVPLLACTADRPPELWQVGAPQTIDQTQLYGSAVRSFIEPGVPHRAAAPSWRSLASRSVAEARGWSDRPGPVHLNLSFRDPLVGTPDELPPGRPHGRPWHRIVGSSPRSRSTAPSTRVTTPAAIGELPRLHDGGRARNGVIVAGRGTAEPDGVLALAARLGWPVLADHRSGCRHGRHAVRFFDAIARCAAPDLEPEVVLRFGEILASKALGQWLGGTTAEVVSVVEANRWSDPEGIADVVATGPGTAGALLAALPDDLLPSEAAARWAEADRRAADAVAKVLAEDDLGQTEIVVAQEVVAGVPAGGALVVASSMPVRDVEWYGPDRGDIAVIANRGANGIDGVLSTAVGVALTGRPTTVLMGDIAFLHDASALIGLRNRRLDLDIVVIDNDGGGIFSFLPQADQLDLHTYELLFGTPHGTDLVALAGAHGIPASEWSTTSRLGQGGARFHVARSERRANAAAHDRLGRAVAEALET